MTDANTADRLTQRGQPPAQPSRAGGHSRAARATRLQPRVVPAGPPAGDEELERAAGLVEGLADFLGVDRSVAVGAVDDVADLLAGADDVLGLRHLGRPGGNVQ